jgi:predicted MarR family transcription regulator
MQDRFTVADRYILTMRIIQPARVQDVFSAYVELWDVEDKDRLKDIIYSLHDKMRADGLLVDVRRGTYILTAKGMEIAARFIKEREIDNRRLFLMKRQRKLYQ